MHDRDIRRSARRAAGRAARLGLTAGFALVFICSIAMGHAFAGPDAPSAAHTSSSFWELHGIGPIDPATRGPLPTSGLPELPGMSGSQSTARLVSILSELGPDLSLGEAFRRVGGPFPVAGAASWSDDWHVLRTNPYPHLHEGNDLMAAYGTPVVAVEDATVSQVDVDDSAGLTVWITDRWDNSFVYMHLSGVANGIAVGRRVRQGDVIAFVGTSGNASSPHLHFEVRPHGVATPPKPLVDRWLRISEARARYLVRTTVAPEPTIPLRPVEPAAVGAATAGSSSGNAVSLLTRTARSVGMPAGPAAPVGWLLVAAVFVSGAVAGLRRIPRRRAEALQPIAEAQARSLPPEQPAPKPPPPMRLRPEPLRVASRPAVIGVSVSLGVLAVWALRARHRTTALDDAA